MSSGAIETLGVGRLSEGIPIDPDALQELAFTVIRLALLDAFKPGALARRSIITLEKDSGYALPENALEWFTARDCEWFKFWCRFFPGLEPGVVAEGVARHPELIDAGQLKTTRAA